MTVLSRNPLPWYGSKVRLMRHLLPLFPDHKTYVSVFGGSAADIALKPRSRQEVYNDLSCMLTTFFRVVSDTALRKELIGRLHWHVPSRLIYEDMQNICREGHPDPVRVALAVYYCSIWSYAGTDPSARTHSGFVVRTRNPVPQRWWAAREHLGDVARRFNRVLVEHQPWQAVIAKYDAEGTFYYCDPPYLPATRHNVECYLHEMTESDHVTLLGCLQAVSGKVMLSGYDSDLYRNHLRAWRRKEFAVRSTASNAGSARTEVVWLNYDEAGKRLSTQ